MSSQPYNAQSDDRPVFDPTRAVCLCGAPTAPGVLCRKCRARVLWRRRQASRARLFQQRERERRHDQREQEQTTRSMARADRRRSASSRPTPARPEPGRRRRNRPGR